MYFFGKKYSVISLQLYPSYAFQFFFSFCRLKVDETLASAEATIILTIAKQHCNSAATTFFRFFFAPFLLDLVSKFLYSRFRVRKCSCSSRMLFCRDANLMIGTHFTVPLLGRVFCYFISSWNEDNQCYGSGMFITDPTFFPSPGSASGIIVRDSRPDPNFLT